MIVFTSILNLLIWNNVFTYLFLITLIMFVLTTIYFIKILNRKGEYIELFQSQHAAKIDSLRKEHSITLENIRNEMLKKEEERTRQWVESEKETLQVLNGISQILELSDNISQRESEKILNEIIEIKKIINSNGKNKKIT